MIHPSKLSRSSIYRYNVYESGESHRYPFLGKQCQTIQDHGVHAGNFKRVHRLRAYCESLRSRLCFLRDKRTGLLTSSTIFKRALRPNMMPSNSSDLTRYRLEYLATSFHPITYSKATAVARKEVAYDSDRSSPSIIVLDEPP
jgi:hypothetical protein